MECDVSVVVYCTVFLGSDHFCWCLLLFAEVHSYWAFVLVKDGIILKSYHNDYLPFLPRFPHRGVAFFVTMVCVCMSFI